MLSVAPVGSMSHLMALAVVCTAAMHTGIGLRDTSTDVCTYMLMGGQCCCREQHRYRSTALASMGVPGVARLVGQQPQSAGCHGVACCTVFCPDYNVVSVGTVTVGTITVERCDSCTAVPNLNSFHGGRCQSAVANTSSTPCHTGLPTVFPTAMV